MGRVFSLIVLLFSTALKAESIPFTGMLLYGSSVTGGTRVGQSVHSQLFKNQRVSYRFYSAEVGSGDALVWVKKINHDKWMRGEIEITINEGVYSGTTYTGSFVGRRSDRQDAAENGQTGVFNVTFNLDDDSGTSLLGTGKSFLRVEYDHTPCAFFDCENPGSWPWLMDGSIDISE
jgi:hypothetical protein